MGVRKSAEEVPEILHLRQGTGGGEVPGVDENVACARRGGAGGAVRGRGGRSTGGGRE